MAMEAWFKVKLLFLRFFPLLAFLVILFAGVYVFFEKGYQPGLIVLGGALVWFILAFRVVPPAFGGLVLLMGGRVIIGKTIRYFKIVDDKDQKISKSEFDKLNGPDIDPEAQVETRKEVSLKYLTVDEGWKLVIPLLQTIVKISLRQFEGAINIKGIKQTDEEFKKRLEIINTFQNIEVVPGMIFSFVVEDLSEVFELGEGIDRETGTSPSLYTLILDSIMGVARDVMGRMELPNILGRRKKDEKNDKEKEIDYSWLANLIRDEVIKSPKFTRLGVQLLIFRIENITYTDQSKDVFDALEGIEKAELTKKEKITEASMRLEVQKIDADAVAAKAEGDLKKAQKEALGLKAKITAFVGKKLDDEITKEDVDRYASFEKALAVAKAMETATKVIIPANDMSGVIAAITNIFNAVKPGTDS